MTAPKGRPSKLVPAAQEILKEYNSRITIRQLYYRFVAKGLIKNSLTSYNVFTQAMITARRDGRIPYSVFEDRTRHSFEGERPNPEIESYQENMANAIYVYENAEEIALDQLKQVHQNYSLPYWINQPYYVEVWVEKEALANIFQPITEKYGVTFVPCKGYASLSLLYDCSQRLRTVPVNREIRILYFGDYDMRGLNIQETIEKNFLDDFHIRAKVIRYALTQEQIDEYQLPSAPAKATDSMAKGWIEKNGNVAWELDALEPPVLEGIIEKAIQSQIDANILANRTSEIQAVKNWMQMQVKAYLEVS